MWPCNKHRPTSHSEEKILAYLKITPARINYTDVLQATLQGSPMLIITSQGPEHPPVARGEGATIRLLAASSLPCIVALSLSPVLQFSGLHCIVFVSLATSSFYRTTCYHCPLSPVLQFSGLHCIDCIYIICDLFLLQNYMLSGNFSMQCIAHIEVH